MDKKCQLEAPQKLIIILNRGSFIILAYFIQYYCFSAWTDSTQQFEAIPASHSMTALLIVIN